MVIMSLCTESVLNNNFSKQLWKYKPTEKLIMDSNRSSHSVLYMLKPQLQVFLQARPPFTMLEGTDHQIVAENHKICLQSCP